MIFIFCTILVTFTYNKQKNNTHNMGCGCKKRKHPIQQQSTPSTIRLTEVTKKDDKPISEDENKIIQQIVEEVKKTQEQS